MRAIARPVATAVLASLLLLAGCSGATYLGSQTAGTPGGTAGNQSVLAAEPSATPPGQGQPPPTLGPVISFAPADPLRGTGSATKTDASGNKEDRPGDRTSGGDAQGSPRWANDPNLNATIQKALGQLPGQVSAVFRFVNAPTEIAIAAADQAPAASTIKVPLAIEVLRQVSQRKLSLDQKLTVTSQVIVGGTGILQKQPGKILTLRELLETTIAYSDNTGGNMLINLVGFGAVNATMAELGFGKTVLQRKFMDLDAQKRGQENYTSAAEMAEIFLRISQGKLIDQATNAELNRILLVRGQQTDPTLDFVTRRITPRPAVAHLNGVLTGIRNEAALMPMGDKTYVLTIYLRNLSNETAAEDEIAKASATIWNAVAAAQ